MASKSEIPATVSRTDRAPTLDRRHIDAVLLDLDGVVTETVEAHLASWKSLFDSYLADRAPGQQPFGPADYLRYVDGRPRYEGVRTFLESRGIELPFGAPDDTPGLETVCGLGNRKNVLFGELIETHVVTVFQGTLNWIDELRDQGFRLALVTSSRNAPLILAKTGIAPLFEAVVDGTVAADLRLPGKPAPDTYLEAARQLDTPAQRAVVVEDAEVGVAAGRSGGFGLVIGVARAGNAETLRAAGADIVVEDLQMLCRVKARKP